MAYFRYQGRDQRGRVKTGRLKADSRKEALQKLRDDSLTITSLHELTGILYKEIYLGRAVKTQDFVIYLRQFATLIKAGISIVDATRVMAEQTTSKVLKRALKDIEQGLEGGNSYSDCADKHRSIFPPLFINMIRAGEAGGNLDEILERLAFYYEKQHRTKQKVKSAMSYPAVVGAIAVIIVTFLLAFVVPTFASMFASFGSELPLITKVVLNGGKWFNSFWWTLPLLVGIVYMLIYYIRQHKQYRYYLDYALLKTPVFGKLLQKAAIARLSRTLSSLFSSSVPILHALSIVERIAGNEVIARVMRDSRASLEKGGALATPMKKHWVFPPLVTQMVVVGEKTGALDSMLDKVADFYEAEVDTATDQIKALIEPVMIILLSIIVGGIVLSIVVPMLSLFEQVGR